MIDGVLVVMPAFRHASSTRSIACQAVGSDTSKPVTRSSSCTAAPSRSSRSTSARPIPPAAPVTSAVSGNKDDLPDVPPRLDQLVRVASLLERERRADQRLHRARRPQLQELADRLLHELGLVAHQPPEVEALHAEVPPDQRSGINRLPP